MSLEDSLAGSDPVSPGERGLLFQYALEGPSANLNVAEAWVLDGEIDLVRLVRATEAVVARHPNLRSTFLQDDEGSWVKAAIPVESALPRVSSLGSDESIDVELAKLSSEPWRPGDPTFRCSILRLTPRSVILWWSMSHAVCDAWSKSVFRRDLSTAYLTGRLEQAPSPTRRMWTESVPPEVLASLAPSGDVRLLPTARSRKAGEPRSRAQVPFALPLELSSRTCTAAAEARVSVFTLVASATALAVARLSGSRDVYMIVPFANRVSQEDEDEIGLLMRSMPIHIVIDSKATAADVVRRMQGAIVDGMSMDIPFDLIVQKADLRGRARYAVTSQVSVSMQDAPCGRLSIEGCVVSPVELSRSDVRHDLEVNVWHEAGIGVHGHYVFDSSLFDRDQIDEFDRSWRASLSDILEGRGERVVGGFSTASPEPDTLYAGQDSEGDRVGALPLSDHANLGRIEDYGRVIDEVRAIWREVLDWDEIGDDENFFDLGGHSLAAGSVIALLRERSGVLVSLRDFLADPTVAGLASKCGVAKLGGSE